RHSLYVPIFRAPRPLPSFPTRRSSDLRRGSPELVLHLLLHTLDLARPLAHRPGLPVEPAERVDDRAPDALRGVRGERLVALRVVDRKSTRLNSSHVKISYAVFCLKKKI